jgi:PncC family amidohydrolase
MRLRIGKIQNSLIEKKLTLSVAESCTGGLLSAMLTALPGSSAYFQGGAVTYSNDSKSKILTVSPEVIKQFGAVSAEVAADMALGISRILGTSFGISITGIAGPGGGSVEKPVGMVWCGLAQLGKVVTYKYLFEGNRDEIRLQAINCVLGLLHARI